MCPSCARTFGHWGEEALRFLNQLSRKNQNVAQFKGHWRKRLSIILQKCNAGVLLKNVSRLSCDNIVAFLILTFNIKSISSITV